MRIHTDIVRKIRRYARHGYTNAELAEAFGVSTSTVWRIVQRRAYADVTDDESVEHLVDVQPNRAVLDRTAKRQSREDTELSPRSRRLLLQHLRSRDSL